MAERYVKTRSQSYQPFSWRSLKHTLRSVFEEVALLLAQEGLLSIDLVYTDGTKNEANAKNMILPILFASPNAPNALKKKSI